MENKGNICEGPRPRVSPFMPFFKIIIKVYDLKPVKDKQEENEPLNALYTNNTQVNTAFPTKMTFG